MTEPNGFVSRRVAALASRQTRVAQDAWIAAGVWRSRAKGPRTAAIAGRRARRLRVTCDRRLMLATILHTVAGLLARCRL